MNQGDWNPGEEPWNAHTAKQVIRRIMMMQGDGALVITRHVSRRMDERDMTMVDLLNILRGGWIDESRTDLHPKTNSWCYRLRTNEMWVEVAFDWPDAIRLVSCGRYR